MTFHTSPAFSFITMLIPLFVAFLLWRKINEGAAKLDFPEEKRKSISLISGVLLFGWFFLVLGLALLDIYHVSANFISPLVPMGAVLPGIIIIGLMLFSETLNRIVDTFAQPWIISLQLFRSLGIVFLWQYEAGNLPALFAIPAGYGDIITGLSALAVAYICLKNMPFSRTIAITWNVFGIADLVSSVLLGILLVLPAPLQLVAVMPTTEIMTTSPLVLVPAYAVPLAFILHVFSLKGLLKR